MLRETALKVGKGWQLGPGRDGVILLGPCARMGSTQVVT
jgi:hypothetical protein